MFCCNGEMRNVVFFPQMLCHNFVRIASKSQSLPVYVQRRYRYKRQWVTCHRIVYFFCPWKPCVVARGRVHICI